jgi:hypothetical protein
MELFGYLECYIKWYRCDLFQGRRVTLEFRTGSLLKFFLIFLNLAGQMSEHILAVCVRSFIHTHSTNISYKNHLYFQRSSTKIFITPINFCWHVL